MCQWVKRMELEITAMGLFKNILRSSATGNGKKILNRYSGESSDDHK